MIGILLTIFAIFLYIKGNKKWSILLFACFSYRGFVLLTDNVMDFKNQDAALIFFVVIYLYSSIKETNIEYRKNPELEKFLKCFFIFMVFSIFFSAFHYGLDLYQIIQGSRRYFIIFSFYFLRKLSTEDVKWVLDRIVQITVMTAILYIIQSSTALPVLPDSEIQLSSDSIDGTLRYYNYPPALEISVFLLLFDCTSFKKNWKWLSLIILIIALIFTQGRTLIAGVLFVIVLSIFMRENIGKSFRYIMLIAICLLPFFPMVIDRFHDDGNKSTKNELTSILSGGFMKNDFSGGTMSFRFALVYERMDYLIDRPLGEKIFGMGLLSDQQVKLVNSMYHFNIGLRDREDGSIVQLSTPDIAYGNLICKLGFIGMLIYLIIWGVMLKQAFKRRKQNDYVLSLFCLLFVYFYTSFAGATISYAEYSVIPFLIYPFFNKNDENI